MESFITDKHIINKIYVVRDHKVMLDRDLAALYGVTTKRLNEQVKRNYKRFPSAFMFQLHEDELDSLRSQNATSSWGGRRYLPYAFTEHGALMRASVLKSDRAIDMSISVINAFIQMREVLRGHAELRDMIQKLDSKTDKNFQLVWKTLKQLIDTPVSDGNRIGFK